ncbi:phage tail spike protein, partial [Streptococcus constellatus]|uniref:phage tail spike protein n=1 Tax=Streptococcus constellatus TaxID=76860 RepID=UPI002493E8AA
MLFLLDRGVKAIKWNGIPLHEADSAIVKEEQNGDFTLNVRYPITDSGIYQLIQEDMLIKAPAPVLGPQLFRIKKPIENDDHLEIQAYHITDDVMKRSVKPLKVVNLGCAMALSQMVQNAKADIQDFSFTSDIWDKRTFNTTEDDTLYSILLDGKHSIVGTWEGELVRDNFALTVKKNRGTNRGVIITTHKNLKSYQRTKDSQNVVTRIYAKSTFKAEGAEEETTLKVTVDSPLSNSYPYVNEKEYENNNAKTIDELKQWAEAKFKNEGIDKPSDAIKIEAYELDGQVVHMGDIVNIKSRKHNVDLYKKAVAYEFDCLANNGKGAYISITFDDKPGVGGSRVSNGISSVATEILEIGNSAQEIAIERALRNADKAFDAEFEKQKSLINDGIEQAKAKAEQVKSEINQSIEQKLQQTKSEVIEKVKQDFNQELANANAEIGKVKQNLTNLQSNSEATTKQLKSDLVGIRTKQSEAEAEINKQVQALTKTKEELAGVKSAQATYEQTTTRKMAELTNLTNGKAERSYVEQTSRELLSKIASVSVGGRNLFLNSLFKQDIKKTGIWTTSTYAASTDSANKYLGHSALKIVGQDPVKKDGNNPKITYPALGMFGEVVAGSATDRDVVISFYAKSAKNGTILLSRLGNVGYADNQNASLTTEIKHYVVKIPRSATKNAEQATNEWLFRLNQADTIWIWMPKFEFGTVDTAYSEAPEDTDSQITAVESSFKQRADSIEAGVSSLREGLKTKADSSALSLLSDRLQASVKSLETDTQNKLNQKLSTAEFEVRATGIRQEIVNATKDKADKSLVTAEAGRIREEISRISVGGRNLLKGSKGEFKPDRNPSNFDNWQVFYASEIYLEEGKQYIISGKTDGIFSNNHQSLIESDNVILWFLNKSWTVTQIVSGPDTGTTGTKFIWNNPTGIYCLRVNTYHKDARKKVWEVKVEQGTIRTDWSPAPEDTDEQITAARAA